MTSRAIVSALLLLALVGCKGAGTDAGPGGAGSAVIPSGTFTSGAGLSKSLETPMKPGEFLSAVSKAPDTSRN